MNRLRAFLHDGVWRDILDAEPTGIYRAVAEVALADAVAELPGLRAGLEFWLATDHATRSSVAGFVSPHAPTIVNLRADLPITAITPTVRHEAAHVYQRAHRLDLDEVEAEAFGQRQPIGRLAETARLRQTLAEAAERAAEGAVRAVMAERAVEAFDASLNPAVRAYVTGGPAVRSAAAALFDQDTFVRRELRKRMDYVADIAKQFGMSSDEAFRKFWPGMDRLTLERLGA